VADEEEGSNQQNQGGKKPNLVEQAMNALKKQSNDAALGKMKEIMKRRQEAMRTVALCDAEAQRLVEDVEAGLI
jgi:hypothetical protein